MITFLPDVEDGLQYYILVPQKETLYGCSANPLQYLRVTDPLPGNSSRQYQTFQAIPDNPESVVTVETVDIKTFLEFATYGYTPYLEVAFCGLSTGFDFEPYKDFLIAQSAFRGYEQRCRTLLDICDEKKFSVSARVGGDAKTERLVDELKGSLLMWEMLMNTGTIRAADCLSYIPENMSGSFPLKQMKEKFEELQNRNLINNFVNLPFKITEDKRAEILSRLG